MAAPEFVPTKPAKPGEDVRVYGSPPRRPETWRAQRPADFAEDGRQPVGERLGNQGPDQGYALKLGTLLEPELHLTDGEHARDAVAGYRRPRGVVVTDEIPRGNNHKVDREAATRIVEEAEAAGVVVESAAATST